jgi:hypothetical protein
MLQHLFLDILEVFLHFEQAKIVCSAQKIIFSVLNCHTIFKAPLKINKFKKYPISNKTDFTRLFGSE